MANRRGIIAGWCPSLCPTGGTLLDRFSRNNHGTLTNMSIPACWVISGGKYALDFAGGTTNRVEGTSPISLATFSQPFTTTAWFNSRTWRGGTGGYFTIWNIGTANFQTACFIIIDKKVQLLASSNGLSWTIGDPFSVGGSSSIGTTTLANNTWYHVGITRSAAGVYTAWLNGKSDGTRTLASNLQFNNSTLRIGCHYALNTSVDSDGFIDDMLIWNRALSATEVWKLYQAGRGGVYKQLQRTRLASVQRFQAGWARGSNVILQPCGVS